MEVFRINFNYHYQAQRGPSRKPLWQPQRLVLFLLMWSPLLMVYQFNFCGARYSMYQTDDKQVVWHKTKSFVKIDPVFAAHVLNLSHRLVSEFLQGRRGSLTHRIPYASIQETEVAWKTSLEVHLPRELGWGRDGAQVPRRSPGSGRQCRS